MGLAAVGLRIFGLPTHPLVVHLAVVLLPLSALAFITLLWRDQWREVYLLPVTLLGIAGTFFVFIAKQTGDVLADVVLATGADLGSHPEHGRSALLFSVAYCLAALGTYVVYEFGYEIRERLGIKGRFQLPISDEAVAYIMTIPVAAFAILQVIEAGHSGSSLAWKDFP